MASTVMSWFAQLYFPRLARVWDFEAIFVVKCARIRSNRAMQKFCVEVFVLAALLSTCCSAGDATVNGGLVITRADRVIDLTSHIVRITTKMTVENAGAKAADHVHFAVDSSHASQMAYIGASVRYSLCGVLSGLRIFSTGRCRQ